MSTTAPPPAESPLATPGTAYRWGVLVAVSLVMFGNYYVYDSLGLVADLLKQVFAITDAQYGFLSGIYSIAAVIVLLLGGAVIDRIGSKRSVLYFGAIAAGAGFLIALAPSYHVMLGGRFLLGIGSEPLSVAVTIALARWFKGRELAFALGLNLTVSRLGSVAADRSPQWASWAYRGDSLAAPLRLAALIGLCCVVGGIIYYGIEHGAERRYRLGAAGSTDKLTLREVLGFGVPYWLLVGLCVTFYSAIFAFQSFATKFFIEAHGVPRDEAGALVSYLPGATMVATPLFGLLVDRLGHRALGLLLGALSISPVYFMMAHRGLSLFYAVALMGIGFSLIPAILWPVVTYLVDEKRLGTAYALMTLLQQIFVFVVSALLGWANDVAQASAHHPAGYAVGMWILGALSLLGVLFALLFYVLERRQPVAVELTG